MNNIYLYIFLMFAVTYAVRILPLTLIRKPIENRFVKSFLFYVPYVTLAVMTFPAIIDASERFPELRNWAWDVALLPDGNICMIELNPWYGIEHLQCTAGGMRRRLRVYPRP